LHLVQAVGNMGPLAEDAVPAVLGFVERLNPRDPRLAIGVTALGKIGSAAPEVLDTLVQLQSNAWMYRPDVKIALIDAMGTLGRGDAEIESQLSQGARHHQNTRVRMAALKALAQVSIDNETLEETCEALLMDEKVNIRLAVCALLAQAGGSEQAAMDLVILLQDDCPLVRLLAARSLGSFGADAAVALPALSRALEDPSNFGSCRGRDFECESDETEIFWDLIAADLRTLQNGSVRQAVIDAIQAIKNSQAPKTAHR